MCDVRNILWCWALFPTCFAFSKFCLNFCRAATKTSRNETDGNEMHVDMNDPEERDARSIEIGMDAQ